MPRTRSLAWSELKIGVLTIFAIVIVAITIFMLTGGKGFFWQRYTLKTRFSNVAGLKPGSPVRVAGKEVGSVTAIEFAGEQIDVTFQLNKEIRDKVTTESIATLGSVSLLGEGAVDVTPSSAGTPVPEWGYVKAGRPPAQIAEITDQASQGMAMVNKLVAGVSAGQGTVGKLLTDERLYMDLQRFVDASNEMVRSVREGRGTIGKLINDPKSANALESSLKNVEEVTRRINAGDGSIGKLLKDDAFSRSLTTATDNIRLLTDRINRGEGTVGKLMTDDALFKRMDSLTKRLDDLVTKLNDGEGTAGQLLKDKQLYENMNKTVNEVQALIADIRKDPKKYLNVKVSIF
jgi:phospholipid/cholesterol/gamma-HCH transport system substrate-binding protein